jgi:putative effector of murein hydrolase
VRPVRYRILYAVFDSLSAQSVSATAAIAEGGILAMLIVKMIAEPFEISDKFTGTLSAQAYLIPFIFPVRPAYGKKSSIGVDIA